MTSQIPEPKEHSLAPDEKISRIMVYTPNNLIRGEVITKQIIRVSTWLRSTMAPHHLYLHNAQVLILGNAGSPQTLSLSEFIIPVSLVTAYHLVLPAQDPMDYDANEPNRKMEAATLFIGSFRFKGYIRISSQSTIEKHLDISKEPFMSFYDVEITNPSIPAMATIKAPLALFRQNSVMVGK